MEKLKSLKPVLKAWNWEVFRDVELRKEALSHIFGWDDLEYTCPFTLIELGERGSKRWFQKWALFEEISWRQK